MLVGPATIGSKDGRTVNWRCDVAIAVGSGSVEQPSRPDIGAATALQSALAATEAVLNPGDTALPSGRPVTIAAAERPDARMQQERQAARRPARDQDQPAEHSTVQRRLPTPDSPGPGPADGKLAAAAVAARTDANVNQVRSSALAPAELLTPSLPQAAEKVVAADGASTDIQPKELRRSEVEQVAKPGAAPPQSPPASSANSKSHDGFTAVETLALIVGALLFGGVAYWVYPRFFQANAERYYASAWARFKRRIMFAAAWAAGGAVICFGAVMR